jgi:AbrB family looped-hinge helix DNA binding protein
MYYFAPMKATLTSKGQITIPAPIRKKLGLNPGQAIDFDENAPFLKGVPAFDEEEMLSVVGCAHGKLERSSRAWLEETRGPVDLPKESS